jgi:nucleoside-diphosphate-sugar epimerase
MAGELVLITGASGHIGYRTLVETLQNGYRVRAAVRSKAKQEQIANAAQDHASQLSFVLVPDIEQENAYDEAVKGVDYILHIASPLAKQTNDFEKDIIQPAIRGTLNMLNSALKEPSITRVVITSSALAINPSTPKTFTADNIEPDPSGPYADPFSAYGASKKLAYNRTLEWIQQTQPHFNVVHILPTFVFGPNDLAKSRAEMVAGSNAVMLGRVLAGDNGGLPIIACHVDDVAVVHVKALQVEGNRSFGVNYAVEKYQWEDAKELVRKEFPKAVEDGVFKLGGHFGSVPVDFDASATEKEFGIEFKSFETAVRDLVKRYLEAA